MSVQITNTPHLTRVRVVRDGINISTDQVTFESVSRALGEADAIVDLNGQTFTTRDPLEAQEVATRAYVDANSGGGGGVRTNMTTSAPLSSSNRDGSYTNTGAGGEVVATLPSSSAIGSSRWRGRFMVTASSSFRFAPSGLDSLNFFGNIFASLASATVGDVIDIEYAGGGAFLVTSAMGQGWNP